MKTFPPSPIALEIYILFAPLDLLSALSLPTLYSGGWLTAEVNVMIQATQIHVSAKAKVRVNLETWHSDQEAVYTETLCKTPTDIY